MGIEYKATPAFPVKVFNSSGEAQALVAVCGNLDLQGDVIQNGAFRETIKSAGVIRVLDNHQNHSVVNIIGSVIGAEEIGKDALPALLLEQYPDATGALRVQMQFLNWTGSGGDIYERIKAGLCGWSIGYITEKQELSTIKRGGKTIPVRLLTRLQLLEVSPVVFAANPATLTVTAKNAGAKSDAALLQEAEQIQAEIALTREMFDLQKGIRHSLKSTAQILAELDTLQDENDALRRG